MNLSLSAVRSSDRELNSPRDEGRALPILSARLSLAIYVIFALEIAPVRDHLILICLSLSLSLSLPVANRSASF